VTVDTTEFKETIIAMKGHFKVKALSSHLIVDSCRFLLCVTLGATLQMEDDRKTRQLDGDVKGEWLCAA